MYISVLSAGDTSDVSQKESTWPRSIPPRKKKEKDVFRFLKEESAVNYTVRRQEFQMSRVIEKCRSVKEVCMCTRIHMHTLCTIHVCIHM